MHTLEEAKENYRVGKPFEVRVEFQGTHPQRGKQGMVIHDWMTLSSNGLPPTFEINAGGRGTFGLQEPWKVKPDVGFGFVEEYLSLGAFCRSVLKEPYASIRKIIKSIGIADTFYAYDGNGNYLLKLTKEGADAVINADPFRIEMG